MTFTISYRMPIMRLGSQLLREARIRARVSQTDVARRSGITQSVISAYEAGHREPSLRTLTKLIEATGCTLAIEVIPPPQSDLGLPYSPLGRQLRRHRQAVLDLAERAGVGNVRVFGSVARGEDTPRSDVDLLVDLRPGVGLFDLVDLGEQLGDLLGTDVDIVPANALKSWIRDRVLAEAIAL